MEPRILILGAGPAGPEHDPPVWLAEQGRELLLERMARVLAPLRGRLVFAVRAQDIRRYRLDSVIQLASPGAAMVPVHGTTAGAACTALLCIDHIEPEAELLILAGNELLDIDYAVAVQGFRDRGLDAGVVVFPSLHPRYSYVRLDAQGMIEEAAEKNPISRHAAAGFTWFRRGGDFLDAARNMIRKDAQHDGAFFISLTLNELVLAQKRMSVHEIDARRYLPLKSRRQVAAYEAEGDAP